MLFQDTKDHNVAKFCKGIGFRDVVELKPRWHQLSPSVRAYCQSLSYDSWLCVKSDTGTLLNLNDCVLHNQFDLTRIKRRVGEIDVLLTQFSYANWSGNAVDIGARQEAARFMLEKARLQAEILRPRYIIPFASYIWFCHEENYYMNDSSNRPDAVYSYLRDTTDSIPIVLYPGERWRVGDPHDAAKSISKYDTDYSATAASPKLVKSDHRRQSEALETMETKQDLRLVTEPGGLLIFSAAHMHATVPNTSGETRFSIDFRTVHLDDLAAETGAPNIDSDCTGTTIDDYLGGEEFVQLPEEIRTSYVESTRPVLA